jgi:hypothetical protein
MTKLAALSLAAMLVATTAAQSQSIKTVTTTGPRGTATTEIKRDGNAIVATTRFVPAKPGYQPMGGSGYKPTGDSGYKPMGR